MQRIILELKSTEEQKLGSDGNLDRLIAGNRVVIKAAKDRIKTRTELARYTGHFVYMCELVVGACLGILIEQR